MESYQLRVSRGRAERFGQLFQLIGNGYAEYIALTERTLQNTAAAPTEQKQQQKQEWCPSSSVSSEHRILMENYRLYKCHAQRLAKLHRDYDKWRQKLDNASSRLFPNNSSASSSFAPPLPRSCSSASLSRFAHPFLLCGRRPSPQRQYRARSNTTERAEGGGAVTGTSAEEGLPNWPTKSRSVSDLCCASTATEEEPREPLRVIRAAMGAIEAETCGMLGRLQFDVQAIVGFARLCVGDVFEVVVKHGHQRWKARGKTLADKSQRWDQQTVTMSVLWGMPVVVKVVEVKFLKSRCLNERQFDPAKFALAQPQLVTMNLNNVGSIKLRLVVSWLPLLSSKPMGSQPNSVNGSWAKTAANGNGMESSQAQQQPRTNPRVNGHGNSWGAKGQGQGALPPKGQQNEGDENNNNEQEREEEQEQLKTVDGSSPVKVCLRDKKRQREQRLQLVNSVAMGTNLTANKEKWRCSSTTLLDELYKDLAKSIPTIDDLTVLNPNQTSSSARLSLLPQPHHRSFASESEGKDSEQYKQHNHNRNHSSNARRIFSFVKRGHSEASAADKRDWRKSASLGQISLSKDEQFILASTAQTQEPQKPTQNGCSHQSPQKIPGTTNSIDGESPKRSKLSSLKKGRMSEGPSSSSSSANSSSGSSASASLGHPEEPLAAPKSAHIEQQQKALKTAEALLARVDRLRAGLAKLSGAAEYTELVAFEAAMLNWEACLKLNRAALMCQLDAELNGGRPVGGAVGSILRRQTGGGSGSRGQMRRGMCPNRTSLYQLNNGGGPNSPSTASDETDESGGGMLQQHHRLMGDQISENDSGIDSLRQHHSPFNSANRSIASGSQQQFSQKDRRKSLGAVLELDVDSAPATSAASGNVEVDRCLGIHLDRAMRAIQTISEVQESPFEFTLNKMLYRMEGIETVALETMLALVQNAMVQCPPNAENVLAHLGAELVVRDCWLSVSRPLGAFLLVPARLLHAKLLKLCQPIVQGRYPKLVDRVIDSLMALISDQKDTESADPISVFQFVGLFRGKSFAAFVENLSHEAWINSNLASGQSSAVRAVMDRLRGVPVVPPLESLRHIAQVLAGGEGATGPIEKYLRKATPELQLDLAACFLCLLEHEDVQSRCGACRALALLKQENSLRCLDFLSRSDAQVQVRTEARKAVTQIQRNAYYESTKI